MLPFCRRALAALLLVAAPAAAQRPGSAGDLSTLDIDQLSQIKITSVARKPESVARAAAAVSVITRDDIRRSGAISIPEALRLVPGLEVARAGTRDWAISARGFNETASNKLLVLVDGRPIYSSIFAGVFWDMEELFLDEVDRIEVIRGPGATLWGANAVNGVINIITRPAAETRGGIAYGLMGSGPNSGAGIRYGGELGKGVAARVFAKATDQAATELASGAPGRDRWQSGVGGFRADWTRSAASTLTLAGDLFAGTGAQRLGVPLYQSPFSRISDHPLYARDGDLRATWQRTLSDRSGFSVQAYLDRAERDDPAFLGKLGVTTADIDFQHRFPIGTRHDVLWGLEARHVSDRVTGALPIAFAPAHRVTTLLTGFLQDEMVVLPERVALTLGTRVEHNDYSGTEVEPSVRLLVTPGLSTTLWGAVSRAVRAPSRVDADVREVAAVVPGTPPTAVTLAGNPAFESERLWAYELGYRAVPRPNLSVDVATFYNDYDRLRTIRPLAPTVDSVVNVPYTVENFGQGWSYGVEASVGWQPTARWHLRGTYTYLHLLLKTVAGAPSGSIQPTRASANPQHQAALWSFLDLPKGWEVDAGVRFVSAVSGPLDSIPRYVTGDLRIGWRWHRLSLSVAGQSLFQPRHAEFQPPAFVVDPRLVERRGYLRAAWSF